MMFQIPDIPTVGTRLSANGFSFPLGDLSNTFLGSLVKGVHGLWDDYIGNTANRENIEFQKEYNEQVFKRADTQYQRTVADLRAAGLSSQLAAGAPSSFAGSTSAPQRTVGNESEAIERLIGMVSSLKRTEADVNLVNAQADEVKSKTALNEAQLPWVDKLNDSSYVKSMAEKEYTMAMTRLKQLEGDNFVKKLEVEFKQAYSEINKNNALADLYSKQMDLAEAETGKVNAEKSEVRERTEKLKQEINNLKIDFENKVKEGLHLDASTDLLVQQAANAWLDYQVVQYNLMMSEGLGLRTNENIPSSMFSSLAWSGHTLDDMFWGRRDTNIKRFAKDVLEWNKEWTPLYWITSGDYPWKK